MEIIDGHLDSSSPYVSCSPLSHDDNTITLDGDFTLEQLRDIVKHMEEAHDNNSISC